METMNCVVDLWNQVSSIFIDGSKIDMPLDPDWAEDEKVYSSAKNSAALTSASSESGSDLSQTDKEPEGEIVLTIDHGLPNERKEYKFWT